MDVHAYAMGWYMMAHEQFLLLISYSAFVIIFAILLMAQYELSQQTPRHCEDDALGRCWNEGSVFKVYILFLTRLQYPPD